MSEENDHYNIELAANVFKVYEWMSVKKLLCRRGKIRLDRVLMLCVRNGKVDKKLVKHFIRYADHWTARGW